MAELLPRRSVAGCDEWRSSLSNGLRVSVVRRDVLPIVSATLLLPAGVAGEREEEAGLAGLTASLLRRGTLRRDATRLAEEIEGLGATLGVAIDYDYALAGISGLSRDAGTLLETLAEILMEPAFDPRELERRRGEVLGAIRRRQDDPGSLVRHRFLERLYGAHPYHAPHDGDARTVARLTDGDLRSFHARYYRPDGAVLAIVGDVDPPQALSIAERVFGPWASSPAAPFHPPPVEASEAAGLVVIPKPGLAQTVLRLGNLALRRDSPLYLAAMVANFILGGSGPGCRLMRALREERGLVYGVHSNVHPRLERGYFYVEARTARATAAEALATIQGEIERFLADGITREELDLAVRFFTGSLPLALETNDQLATNLLSRDFYRLEEEFWLRDIEAIARLGPAAVHDAARAVIRPDRFVVVRLGEEPAAGDPSPVALDAG